MKQPIAKKGDFIAVEDNKETFMVVAVRRVIVKEEVWKGKNKRYPTYEYEVKHPKGSGKKGTLFVDENDVLGVVNYKPVYMDNPVRHLELCQELFGYEGMIEYVSAIKPKNKRDRTIIRTMKELLETVALLVAGNGDEYQTAQENLEQILR